MNKTDMITSMYKTCNRLGVELFMRFESKNSSDCLVLTIRKNRVEVTRMIPRNKIVKSKEKDLIHYILMVMNHELTEKIDSKHKRTFEWEKICI